MRRTTPRPSNPYRQIYKAYADAQFTLEELLEHFEAYDIYGTLDNPEIHIVDGDQELLFFVSIGYDDDDCVPTIYQASAELLGQRFSDVSSTYVNNNFPITKLHEGVR